MKNLLRLLTVVLAAEGRPPDGRPAAAAGCKVDLRATWCGPCVRGIPDSLGAASPGSNDCRIADR